MWINFKINITSDYNITYSITQHIIYNIKICKIYIKIIMAREFELFYYVKIHIIWNSIKLNLKRIMTNKLTWILSKKAFETEETVKNESVTLTE